jgi:hypothetical protein
MGEGLELGLKGGLNSVLKTDLNFVPQRLPASAVACPAL